MFDSNTQVMIEQARRRLRSGNLSRDDAFHTVVRWAAQKGLDRYALWLAVVGQEDA